MNARLLALACLLAAPPALAQRPPEVLQTPLGPPGSPPPAPESPQSPEQPPPQNVWLPQKTADLIALDKVSARVSTISVPVGQSAGFGSLTIDVRACLVRPPDQAADATAWLDITDSHPGSPQFHGWILLSAPGLSMLQHPVYDIRLADCR